MVLDKPNTGQDERGVPQGSHRDQEHRTGDLCRSPSASQRQGWSGCTQWAEPKGSSTQWVWSASVTSSNWTLQVTSLNRGAQSFTAAKKGDISLHNPHSESFPRAASQFIHHVWYRASLSITNGRALHDSPETKQGTQSASEGNENAMP